MTESHYTVHARIVVHAAHGTAAETAVRDACIPTDDGHGIVGVIVEATEPSEPADVAWTKAQA